MERTKKVYTIREYYSPLFCGKDREKIITGTLEELIDRYSYQLEVGACYQTGKGRKKINKHPTTIKSFITNLENARNNAQTNGYSGYSYSLVEV